jgi:hypothetical protein
MSKRLAVILLTIGLVFSAGSANASVAFTDVWNTTEYVSGTGDDQALLIIDFGDNSTVDSYRFGFNFTDDDTVTGWDMVQSVGTEWDGVSALDSSVLYYDYTDYGWGIGIDNFYYDGDTTDAGTWWEYFVAETDTLGNFPGWGSSGVGVAGRTLDDLSWDGWYNPGFAGEGTPSVPVPAAVWLLGSGLIGLVGIRRRSRV